MSERRWSPAVREIGDRIAALTVAGAAELGQYLEQVHGVRAAAPPVVRPDPIVEPEPVPPRSTYDVWLERFDSARKVALIRAVRERLGLGVLEARTLVEGAPRVVKEGLPTPEAEQLKAHLESAGATVSLR
jgi:large subunit ribosomal protein L7/L12